MGYAWILKYKVQVKSVCFKMSIFFKKSKKMKSKIFENKFIIYFSFGIIGGMLMMPAITLFQFQPFIIPDSIELLLGFLGLSPCLLAMMAAIIVYKQNQNSRFWQLLQVGAVTCTVSITIGLIYLGFVKSIKFNKYFLEIWNLDALPAILSSIGLGILASLVMALFFKSSKS